MRRLLLQCALVVLAMVAVAPVVSACQVCDDYFDWQVVDWCPICRADYCGYFSCAVRQSAGWGTYCVGQYAGCFEYGGNCSSEPDDYHDPEHRDGPRAMNSDTARLEETWRLVRVQVVRKAASRRG